MIIKEAKRYTFQCKCCKKWIMVSDPYLQTSRDRDICGTCKLRFLVEELNPEETISPVI